MIYFSVDYFQTALYLTVDVSSEEFWIMIGIGEIGSLAKNGGLLQYLMWCVCLRKTNPYNDADFVKMLRSKGAVDSLSELLVGFSAFVHYVLEMESRTWAQIDMYNVTFTDLSSNITSFFLTEQCSITCMGYNVDEGVPPPPVESLKKFWTLLGLFSFISSIRVGFLLLETTLVNKMEARAVRANTSTVMPDADGDNADEVEVEAPVSVQVTVSNSFSIQRHASEVTNNVAGLVFKDVSTSFLLVSFLIAMNMNWWGLHLLAFTPADEGTTNVDVVAG